MCCSYSGNPYIFKPSPNSKKSKVRVVLGISLGGFLVIALAVIICITFYRKKFGRKEGAPITVVGGKPVVDPGQ
jgi:hypothetical protein